MKFSLASVFALASATILALNSVQVQAAALPDVPLGSRSLEKRDINKDVKGINNYKCKLTKAHPRPVILVHATLLTADSWSDVAPPLIKEGYCVFVLTYGRYKGSTFGGLAPIEDSAQELATFAEKVMKKLKVKQVDLVGHSQGGILGRYWIKYLGGQGKVYRMVGVSPINHGTTLSGIVTVGKLFGVFDPLQPVSDSMAPSFYQMVNTSPFIAKLNAGGDTAPGVIHSNIATKYDEVVTPYETCFQKQKGVTNILLQDLCMVSINEHLTMVNSKVVTRYILNQLDPSKAKTANCLNMFD